MRKTSIQRDYLYVAEKKNANLLEAYKSDTQQPTKKERLFY